MKLLIQTQLSNYDLNGKFILEADSGWQMTMGRVRQMLKMVKDLKIDVMGPELDQLITSPFVLNKDLFEMYEGRLRYVPHRIVPNALATRFDFDFESLSSVLKLDDKTQHPDAVYINDPMHLRNFKALFEIKAKYQPKFFVHSHFIDNPECPKFPVNASLWLGQCEAALRADYNFWQCESSMNVFFESFSRFFTEEQLSIVRSKSSPWDDGYSSEEINTPVDMKNVRFNVDEFRNLIKDKNVIFVPNRIGGKGRSSDYTNCGKFMFDILPKLRQKRGDFIVIAGNPNQKFTNNELVEMCGKNGYVSLVPNALTRDEFKFVVKHSDVSVGLYDQDSYGGTVARECIDLGCLPLWLDNFEYSTIANESGYEHLAKSDFSDIVSVTSTLLDRCQNVRWRESTIVSLRNTVRNRCSYEMTTPVALKQMGML